MKKKEKTIFKKELEISNRKARFEYAFIETEVAGIVLHGTEIKSIREGKASLSDAYCYVDANNKMWLKNAYIAKYENGTYLNHDERRERKLLLTKRQIKMFADGAKKPGYTIVPVKLFIDAKTYGKCKLLIALAKGKHEYDKRQSIKENEAKREMSCAMKI